MFYVGLVFLGIILWMLMGGLNIAIFTATDGYVSDDTQMCSFIFAPVILAFFIIMGIFFLPFKFSLIAGEAGGDWLRNYKHRSRKKKGAKNDY
jgi:hypothetical protein